MHSRKTRLVKYFKTEQTIKVLYLVLDSGMGRQK